MDISPKTTEVPEENSDEEKFKCSDLKKLNLAFWLLGLSYMLTIMLVINYILISSKIL